MYRRVYKLVQPIVVPSIQSGVLCCTGDVISQTIIERKTLKDYNYVRTGQFAGLGLFMVGPVLSSWYRLLARRIGSHGSGIVTLKKVAFDQGLFAPCFIGIFVSTLGVVQGDKPNQIKANLKNNYVDILLTNYKIWPAAQLVNFYLVPLKYQVLLAQCVALVFNTYLSWKTQSNRHSE